ncbi:MAG: 3-dehydroquinate synthase [Prevotellaceae bacterium]|nr:3-dehydroquinate synthase [Prevotellaceae bacterium]
MPQEIIYTSAPCAAVRSAVSGCDRLFLLADETTAVCCAPRLGLNEAAVVAIPATDASKTLDTLASVWTALNEGGATRHSALVCLGGGMVTDLGGFAAATFKRGIRFVNVPTTLLAMVDAAVGGKTGINFAGCKNEIGVFREAEAVVVDTAFLSTLDAENLRSGYAEMLKHALLGSEEMLAEHLDFDLAAPDFARLQHLVEQSVGLKRSVVEADPTEGGLRKSLNLGHTVGHALESLLLGRGTPVLHGCAVAWGLVAELYLSAALCGFPETTLRRVSRFVREHYGPAPVSCDDYAALADFMLHDKKNRGRRVNFALLAGVGRPQLDIEAPRELTAEALDFLREA